MRKVSTVLVLSAVALVIAACGGSSKTSSTSTPAGVPSTPSTTTSAPASGGVKVSSTTIAGLGGVLVNAQGHTLYTFAPDKDTKVTCVGGCAAIWPPAALPSGQEPVAAGAVNQSLLGSDPNPAGGRVITYAGWPLYAYVADTAPGQHAGQALNLNGGVWHVISPGGTVITKTP